jgi:hypothetical protein
MGREPGSKFSGTKHRKPGRHGGIVWIVTIARMVPCVYQTSAELQLSNVCAPYAPTVWILQLAMSSPAFIELTAHID